MKKVTETELKVGVFVTLGLVLTAAAIIFLGGTKTVFTKLVPYQMHFKSVDGLISGAKVTLGGIQVGTVSNVEFDPKDRDILVTVQIFEKYKSWISTGTEAEIATLGVLGDKYVSFTMGAPDAPPIPPGQTIPIRPTKDISQFFSKSDTLLLSLNSISASLDRILRSFEANGRSENIFSGMAMTAKNLSVASSTLSREIQDLNLKGSFRQLNEILSKINQGSGSLGALINDPSVYDDVKSLLGGVNRNRIVRNIVRKAVTEGERKERKPTNEENP